MAIILMLFDSIQFNSEIKLLNWIGSQKKIRYQIDSINSMYDPESPKVTTFWNSQNLLRLNFTD